MADEQTPQSDLIDDAIRQAERQLEEKLQALRLSALGEPAPQASAPDDDVAVLRPTGSASRAGKPAPAAPEAAHREAGSFDPLEEVAGPDKPVSWQETGGDDLTFAPVGDAGVGSVTDLFIPEDQSTPSWDDTPASSDQDADEFATTGDVVTEEHSDSDAMRGPLSATVTDLTPVWEDEDELSGAPSPTTRRQPSGAERPIPGGPGWGSAERTRREPAESASRMPALPSEDEMQFWAHTRTALRNLQQVTDGLTTQVVGGVSTEVSRLLREEIAPTDQSVRALQQQVQQELPRLAERLEGAIEQASNAPTNAIQQVRSEIPEQVERAARDTRDHLRDELERTVATVHGAVQHDIAQLEQSIATNVTRMAQSTTESVSRIERDVDVLGETVVRVERGVHAEFDRFESQLRGAIERVEQNLRDDLVAPAETLRKLDDELPSRFARVERTVADQLQASQRESTMVLTSLVEADRAALDRLSALASTMDDDRARRAEDLDVIVDTVTTGWEGLAGAITALYEQTEQNARRLAGIEQRLTQIRDLEGAVERTLDEFQRHMRDLRPSPIVVTVSHDEAEVRSASRSGWVDTGAARTPSVPSSDERDGTTGR